MKKLILFFLIWPYLLGYGQIPTGYYDSAQGLRGTPLRLALHNIIKNHNQQTYSSLWSHFYLTDAKPNGKVWDIYTDIPGGNPVYVFSFGTNQCGNYSKEGDCYNREHSWPASWFNDGYPMYSDLFHIYPTDGYVNNIRGNYPYGTVANPTYTSSNGSKRGLCSYTGYSGIVFEPIDTFKGDLARSYFYMITRYYTEDASWNSSDMTTKASLKPWALQMLIQWHKNDPVSQKERARNNQIFLIQGNRNPFIDFPDWVDSIWVDTIPNTNKINELNLNNCTYLSPNPAKEKFQIQSSKILGTGSITILDVTGGIHFFVDYDQLENQTIDVSSLSKGIYFVRIVTKNENLIGVKKLIIQ